MPDAALEAPVPIGVLSRNRTAYLDVTLRSLSASRLPENISVTVFDDASDDPAAVKYLTTDKPVPVPRNWPSGRMWRDKLGLQIINNNDVVPQGIQGKIAVERLGDAPQGVVEASCESVRRLFAKSADLPGVILLQDDSVFCENWYKRLVTTAATHNFGKPLGVLAGIKLNYTYRKLKKPWPPVMSSGITAQCLYISRETFDALDMFHEPQSKRTRFDDLLKKRTNKAGFWAGVILPFVCQHFGVDSLVRPHKKWHRWARGRTGQYSKPPYVLAKKIKRFQA